MKKLIFTLLMAGALSGFCACGGNRANASSAESDENREAVNMNTPTFATPAHEAKGTNAVPANSAETARKDEGGISHELQLGTPQEEMQRVIGDGSASAELDYMESQVRIAEALNKKGATLLELKEAVNNVSYSISRLEAINKRTPLTKEELNRGTALAGRINAIMMKFSPQPADVQPARR